MRFLAIGECMAELAPVGRQGSFQLGFAGDTFNTAWYLKKLRSKASVSYFTVVGSDAISHAMRAAFRQGGIDETYVQSVDDQTVGLYLITLKNGERSFSYWRGQSAARRLAEDPAALSAAVETMDVVYFSGITLAILDPAARECLLAMLHSSRTAGRKVIFDPNLRPGLWETADVMRDVVMAGAKVADIALPSFEDEAVWFADETPEATIQRYANVGCSTVIVKNGSQAVHYQVEGETGVVDVAPLDKVVDTTAAGDSFNAGIVASMGTGLSVAQRIEISSAIASQVIRAEGALVDLDISSIPNWNARS